MTASVPLGVEADLPRGQHAALDGVDLRDEVAVARHRHIASLEEDLEVRCPALLRLVGEVLADQQYATLIDALLQLRRPHLSEKLEPDALSLVLSASLPPPDPKVVGTLAEGFERLDRHRLERQELSSTLQAVSGFLKVYREYAGVLAKAKAQDLTRADSAFHSARAQLKQAQQEHADAAAKLALLAASEEQLGREIEELDERIATLKSSEAYRAVERVDRAEKDALQAQDQARRAGERAERDQSDSEARREKLRVAEERQKDAELKLAEHRDLAARRAEEAALSDLHVPLDRMLQSSATPGARGILLQALLGRREQVLLRLAERTREVHSAQKEEERAAERLREAIERQKQQVETLRDEERKHVAAREFFAAQLSAWTEKLQVLPLDREPLLEAAPADALRQADAAAESARRSLEDEAAPLHGSAREVERELGAVEAQRQELQARTYQPPCAPSWRSERPAERAGDPLYLLCDFGGGDVDQQANVEAALEAAGLLDAWMMPDGTVLGPESETGAKLAHFPFGYTGYDNSQVAVSHGMLYFSGNGGNCDLFALGLP